MHKIKFSHFYYGNIHSACIFLAAFWRCFSVCVSVYPPRHSTYFIIFSDNWLIIRAGNTSKNDWEKTWGIQWFFWNSHISFQGFAWTWGKKNCVHSCNCVTQQSQSCFNELRGCVHVPMHSKSLGPKRSSCGVKKIKMAALTVWSNPTPFLYLVIHHQKGPKLLIAWRQMSAWFFVKYSAFESFLKHVWSSE